MNSADKIWKERYEQNRKKTGYVSSAEHFSKKENADKMAEELINGTMNRAAEQISCLNFSSGESVLDIGAGPGTLAVPLAAKGCIVTAAEPSVPMTDAMERYRIHSGTAQKISVIHEMLEDISPEKIGTYDYVISSFAMAVENLRESLLKMNSLAKKQVHIFWFLNNPSWGQVEEDLRIRIHSDEKSSRSYADTIWNCLFEEGIYANLTVHLMNDAKVYKSKSDASDEFIRRVCAESDEQKKTVRDYLDKIMIQSGEDFSFADNGKYAHIWWDKV